jgi:hypothetical protein
VTTPKSTRLVATPDGTLALVYQDGRPVPADQRIQTTAAEYVDSLAAHAAAAVAAERKAGERRLAEAAQAVADKVAQAYGEAGVKAGVKAGAKLAAEEIAANSTVRRRVERDAKGQITATIEERIPKPEPAAARKAPLGFRR